MLKGMSAEYCLFRLHHLQPGETVLVHAAAGGLGMLTAQWAHALGAQVIGTVGSEDKARIARGYCSDVVIAAEGRFADAVLRATQQRGADLIIDGLGERAREENLQALAMCGHWISVGQAGGAWAPIEASWLSQKSITLSRPVIFHFAADAERRRQMSERVFGALADGTLKPQISRYALSAAADAHRNLESRRTVGQVVLLT
jgi:NADPH:quinone reductase